MEPDWSAKLFLLHFKLFLYVFLLKYVANSEFLFSELFY